MRLRRRNRPSLKCPGCGGVFFVLREVSIVRHPTRLDIALNGWRADATCEQCGRVTDLTKP